MPGTGLPRRRRPVRMLAWGARLGDLPFPHRYAGWRGGASVALPRPAAVRDDAEPAAGTARSGLYD